MGNGKLHLGERLKMASESLEDHRCKTRKGNKLRLEFEIFNLPIYIYPIRGLKPSQGPNGKFQIRCALR
jgi:hypothetical protein